MIPIIARNIFNLQERLLGRHSFRFQRELDESQWWSREKIESLQLQRLKKIVGVAYSKTEYWRRLMDDHGIKPQDIKTLKDVKRFPLLEKDTLRERREEMVWRKEGRRVQLVRTSGSTNEALEFYTSSTREAHINAARMRGHEWVGIRRGEKEMYYWGSPVELSKQDRIKQCRDWLINDGLTNGFELTPERLKGYFGYWIRWKPRCLFGYPSTLVLTVNMGMAAGLELKKLKQNGLKAIITTSEMLLDCDRRFIEENFGVPVFDSFGLREAGLIGHECEHRTMHCMDEQLFLETVDPHTMEPSDGQGELIVTNLVGAAFPVIRYRTGDIVTLSEDKCPCGRNLTSIKISGGRAVEFVVTKDGKWVVGYSFIYIARSVKGIVKFQALQRKLGEIRFRLVVDKNFPADGIQKVEDAVRSRLKSEDRIVVEIVDDISPAPSGKYRPVISKVAEELIRRKAFGSCDTSTGNAGGLC